jgi:predicted lipid carrier protein YhbT
LSAVLVPQFLSDAILRRHPSLRAALAPLAGTSIGIAPRDLPVALVIDCTADQPRLMLKRSLDANDATAVIRGTFLTLIDLCDGRIDGDAAFFARQLSFDGSAAAVVALRNALDGANIDVRRDIRQWITRLPSPFRSPAMGIADFAGRLTDLKRARELERARWN